MCFLDSDGVWRHRPSSGSDALGDVIDSVSSIVPRPLDATEELAAFDGFAPGAQGIAELSAKVYFAYAVPSMDALAYTRDGIDLVVRPDRGQAVVIDRETPATLRVGDTIYLDPLPGRRIGFVLESSRAYLNGDVSWRGVHKERGQAYNLHLVHGPRSVLGSFTSPWGEFQIGGAR